MVHTFGRILGLVLAEAGSPIMHVLLHFSPIAFPYFPPFRLCVRV